MKKKENDKKIVSFETVPLTPDAANSSDVPEKDATLESEGALSKAPKKEKNSLAKSIINLLDGEGNGTIERLAFETDPSINATYQAIYKAKIRLIPDKIIKRIIIQDDLVAAIVQARQNQILTFGRARPDRFSTGFVVEPKTGVLEKMNVPQKQALSKRIANAVKTLESCGSTEGVGKEKFLTFSSYLSQSARNAVGVGRIATEVIWKTNPDTGKKTFHSFRPIDAGTVYRAQPQKAAGDSLRRQALGVLEGIRNKKLNPERFQKDEYKWVQVIDGRPSQAFTGNECLVYNFYPVPDIEADGYPITPLDNAITAVTTHINITTHNKMYFQTGRATRGMLVIQSDDISPAQVTGIKQQFNASINSVSNSWRMPVFGIGTDDSIQWQTLDSSGSSRDAEFQYLTDMNARTILSAFQMSPDELPGWGYLSKGTNSQALSESNNEYKLEAARDLGIRPLLSNFETFIQANIMPLVDKDIARICQFRFLGLDSETAEKESVRLQQDMSIHMTMDEVLGKVEKESVGVALAGTIPLNPVYKGYLDQYFTVGEILEHFCGRKDASKDPELNYRRDPFWFQFKQQQALEQQAQMQQEQMQQQQQEQSEEGDASTSPPPVAPKNKSSEVPNDPKESGGAIATAPNLEDQPIIDDSQDLHSLGTTGTLPGGGSSDLARSIDQAIHIMSKDEENLTPSAKRLLAAQQANLKSFEKGWEKDVSEAMQEIEDVSKQSLAKRRKPKLNSRKKRK